jgi:hypothetical protein
MNDERHLRTWNDYQSAWAPIDEAKRRELLAASVSDDVAYTDPVSQVRGATALAERIAASQKQFPGARFRNDDLLEHHGEGLFHWTMLDADGNDAVKGTSYARFGMDGRIVHAAGFFRTKG